MLLRCSENQARRGILVVYVVLEKVDRLMLFMASFT